MTLEGPGMSNGYRTARGQCKFSGVFGFKTIILNKEVQTLQDQDHTHLHSYQCGTFNDAVISMLLKRVQHASGSHGWLSKGYLFVLFSF